MKRFCIFGLLLFGFFLLMQADRVHACLPPTPHPDAPTPVPYSIEDHIAGSDYVLVGTVISIESYSLSYEAEIAVDQYLKGEGSSIIWIGGFYQSTCDFISPGTRYIFFAKEDVSGRLQIYDNAWYVSEQRIVEIIAVTNHSVAPYPLSLDEQLQQTLKDDKTSWLIVLVSIIGSIAVILFRFKMYRSQRKSKVKRG